MATDEPVPELQTGDRLTLGEFERRYSAMPHLKKAELIERVVYIPTGAGYRKHATAWFNIAGLLGRYSAATPCLEGGVNATVRMDLDNEPQPDVLLRIPPHMGGQSWDDGEYIGGAPELIAEVTDSSASYDLHDKFRVYQRNGLREYVVWRLWDRAIDWFVLREDHFERLPPDASGCYRSEVFPGLWLDPAALVAGDIHRVMAVLQQGLASPQHADFAARLRAAAGKPT